MRYPRGTSAIVFTIQLEEDDDEPCECVSDDNEMRESSLIGPELNTPRTSGWFNEKGHQLITIISMAKINMPVAMLGQPFLRSSLSTWDQFTSDYVHWQMLVYWEYPPASRWALTRSRYSLGQYTGRSFRSVDHAQVARRISQREKLHCRPVTTHSRNLAIKCSPSCGDAQTKLIQF